MDMDSNISVGSEPARQWKLREAVTLIAVTTGFVLYCFFLFYSEIGLNPFVLFGAITFILWPFCRDSYIVRRLFTLVILTFVVWIFKEIIALLVPFIIAFVLAYMLDPVISRLHRRGHIPRSVLAGFVVISVVSAIAALSIIVFPGIFAQLNTITQEINSVVNNVDSFLESNQLYAVMANLGVDEATLRQIIETEVSPVLRDTTQAVFTALLNFFTSLSGLVNQIINIILVPILLFYTLRDFDKIKNLVRTLLMNRNQRILSDLGRINELLHAYVGGQALAALFVGLLASIIFTLLKIPYGIILGIIAGLLNPVPYIGIFSSIMVGMLALMLTGDDNLWLNSSLITITIVLLHFVDNYFFQPRVVGKRVGLHPLLLIASLFVFGFFFNIIGLLIAVPTTSILVMFFNDWLQRLRAPLAPQVDTENAAAPPVEDTADNAG